MIKYTSEAINKLQTLELCRIGQLVDLIVNKSIQNSRH